MVAKRLEVLRDLLRTALPSDAKLGMLMTTALPSKKVEREFAGTEMDSWFSSQARAGSSTRLNTPINSISAVKSGVRALLVSADPFFTNWRNQLVALAASMPCPSSTHCASMWWRAGSRVMVLILLSSTG